MATERASIAASMKAWEATRRRIEREEQRRQKELQHLAKEQARLSVLEQARLEVETFENQLAVLLSIHKEQGANWDWTAVAAQLPPPPPYRVRNHEYFSKQWMELTSVGCKKDGLPSVEEASKLDALEHQAALGEYSANREKWERLKALAHRILAKDTKAYLEAINECSPLSEISALGSSCEFSAPLPHMIACTLKVEESNVIPAEMKSLTANGKVTVKTMPRTKTDEIYQDYVCGCLLRVGREVLALLPIEIVLVTATTTLVDPLTGIRTLLPIYSAALERDVMHRLNFDTLDPSSALDNMLHRGDFKTSRKSGSFQRIVPLNPADLPRPNINRPDLETQLCQLRTLRETVRTQLHNLGASNAGTEPSSNLPI